jgi:catechol 2,3-dioxygenase-like lactoylglutathione lyase family enzyme
MFDHVGSAVRDYRRSKTFYENALSPLGLTMISEPLGEAAEFGKERRASFSIEACGRPVQGRLHIALAADSRGQVDAFHAAAIEAGGTDNGAPGVRGIYHPDYYGAYVLDPDGNNIEAVCHQPAPHSSSGRWTEPDARWLVMPGTHAYLAPPLGGAVGSGRSRP